MVKLWAIPDPSSIKELKRLAEKIDRVGVIRGGVSSEGPASEYALVWEWGNARQTKVGPKTVIGLNPDGNRVFLSIQAPMGYIRVNAPQFEALIESELERVSFRSLESDDLKNALVKAAKRICRQVKEIIQDTVPVDSGDLKASITVVDPGEKILLSVNSTFDEFEHEGLSESSSDYSALYKNKGKGKR